MVKEVLELLSSPPPPPYAPTLILHYMYVVINMNLFILARIHEFIECSITRLKRQSNAQLHGVKVKPVLKGEGNI